MKKKPIIIIAIIALILICGFCLYNYVINPLDETGYRCQTWYNISKHKLVTGEEIEVLEGSCFVADCCMYTSTFRTKMSYEELKKKASELEKELNENYPNKKFKITNNDRKLYREYTIFYEN